MEKCSLSLNTYWAFVTMDSESIIQLYIMHEWKKKYPVWGGWVGWFI